MTEPVEREEYSAKQIATRINVDAKVLRKFFRSAASTVEPVGQGGRYLFDAEDLPQIREEFEKWNAGKAARTAAKGSGTPRKKGRSAPVTAEVIDEEEEILEFDDEEPTDEDLSDLEDIELDDEELDDEELD